MVLTVPSIPGANSYTLGIPAASLSGSSQGGGGLIFSTGIGSVTVPAAMLTGTEGKQAGITIGRGDKDGLLEEVKTGIGDRPIVRLTMSLDGVQAEWNNPDAPVTVSIPYTPTATELANPGNIVIWYIDGSGKAVSVPNGHYDPVTGTVTFITAQGGLYAVCGVKNLIGGGDGSEIYDTWQRFSRWINESKYVAADHQWLEEHLHFNDEFEHTGGMDLYMPIAPKESISKIEKEIVFVEPMRTATMSFNGENAYDEALAFMYEFVGKLGDDLSQERRRTFCYYNHERAGKKDFWCKVHIEVKDDFEIKDDRLQFEVFEGGQYAYEEVEWNNNGKRWYQFIDWVKMSKKYDFDNRPFMEEFIIDSPALKPTTRVKHFMPVRNK